MQAIGSIIETGVDKLVKIVKKNSRISMSDAAKELGVSVAVIHEWADFLEEEGIISVEYKFTKPFLVERRMTKAEVSKKSQEFKSQKEIFVRKAEGALTFLEKEAKNLKDVKKQFDKVKKELEIDIDEIKSEIGDLDKYYHMRADLNKQVQEQRNQSNLKLRQMSMKIVREQRKYAQILNDINKETLMIEKEKKAAKTLESTEKLLKKRLTDLKTLSDTMEKRVKNEEVSIKNSEIHIERLQKLAKSMKENLETEKKEFAPLLEQCKVHEQKIKELQDEILSKITVKESSIKAAKVSSEKFKKLFEKKMKVVTLIDKVNKDRDDLEKDLFQLIKKAKSFNLSSGSKDVSKQMASLQKKFKEVNAKKTVFEKEFKKLSLFFKA